MNRQRKVLITITYNEMGIITDTKMEEVAQPKRPKGKWQQYRVENPDMVEGYVGGYACSECGEPSVADSNYCAWCGADMRGADK